MANTMIKNASIGTVVKAKIGGAVYEFIIVQQGIPSSGNYDSSCNGTWLMLKNCVNKTKYSSTSQLYADSAAKTFIEDSVYWQIENGLRGVIKTVKIPYSYLQDSVYSGNNGLEVKIFLPSAAELGFSTSSNYNQEGSALSYFSNNEDRISKYNGVETTYATRTPDRISNARIVGVYTDGTSVMGDYENDYGIRPMIIIYNTCLLDDDNNIIPDFAPTITSNFATNGEDIGTKTDYFTFTYTVTTARSDLTLAVDEIISGKNITKTKQTIYPSSGYQRTFSLMVDNHEDFYKLLNGEIKLTIRAYYSDYNNAAVNSVTEYYITFTKDVKGAVITLKSPLTVSGTITKGIITLAGDIPDDGLTVQATRNGTSYSPSWQDVTYYVKNNTEFNFTSTSGSAFNFKIILSRDSTNEPRYISAIVGAFE